MPFTVFHFGPGVLLKSVAPRHLSFLSFVAANLAVDLESLYHLVRHDWPVHRWAHTFLAASLIGAAVGVLLAIALRRLPARNPASDPSRKVNAPALVVGGVLGGLTHPALDGLMHSDILPFRPFTNANPLLSVVSVSMLLALCVGTAFLGGVILLMRRRAR